MYGKEIYSSCMTSSPGIDISNTSSYFLAYILSREGVNIFYFAQRQLNILTFNYFLLTILNTLRESTAIKLRNHSKVSMTTKN